VLRSGREKRNGRDQIGEDRMMRGRMGSWGDEEWGHCEALWCSG